MSGIICHAIPECDATVALVDEDLRAEWAGSICPSCGRKLKVKGMVYRDNDRQYVDWATYRKRKAGTS